jgi:hypothetical protein
MGIGHSKAVAGEGNRMKVKDVFDCCLSLGGVPLYFTQPLKRSPNRRGFDNLYTNSTTI